MLHRISNALEVLLYGVGSSIGFVTAGALGASGDLIAATLVGAAQFSFNLWMSGLLFDEDEEDNE